MLGFISHPSCHHHDAGPMHPDTPERLDAINNQLIMSGLDYVIRHYDAPEVTREQLEGAHDPDYIARIFESAPGPGESVEIDEATIGRYLYTSGQPDPDLLIRSSGEQRVSNFMLWQIAYSEIWMTETLWPDFRRGHLLQAIVDFQTRDRRFGAVAESDKETVADQGSA